MVEDSGDEYESSGSSGSDSDRPNRWDGPASTWQDMSREEIKTLVALDEIKSRDLSIHLYNAFALKQRHQKPGGDREPVPEKDINAATGESVHQDDWQPPYSWTAWPMSGARVPSDDFMRRNNNDDDHNEMSTIRKPMHDIPSAALEDAIGANVLRFAKIIFTSRPTESAPDLLEDESTNDKDEGQDDSVSASDTDGGAPKSKRVRSRSRSRATLSRRDAKASNQERSLSDGGESDGDPTATTFSPERVLELAVSTDDQLSYDLMRPSVRSILAKLDTTLMVLHHSRDAGVSHLSDSSSDSEPETTDAAGRAESGAPESPRKRKRGRPIKARVSIRRRTPPPLSLGGSSSVQDSDRRAAQESEADIEPPKTKRQGRPRKIYPRLEGESDRSWANRIARLRKEPIPFPLDSDDPRSTASEIAPRKTRTSKQHIPLTRGSPLRSPKKKEAQIRHNSSRLELRDWKDVLGAAALAGFSQDVLDRAARRCADLFQETVELHSLEERPTGQDSLEQHIQYHPGMATLDPASGPAEEEEIDSDDETQSHTVRHIRASSAMSISSDPRGRSQSRSRSVSRASTRSRSRSSSVAGVHYCSVIGCSRGAEGFARRYNLLRHMKLVHHMEQDEVPTDVDSEDEMHGAIHVDGFLRPIKTRKGWRGETTRRSESVSSKRANAGRHSKRKDRHSSATDAGGEDTDVIMGEG